MNARDFKNDPYFQPIPPKAEPRSHQWHGRGQGFESPCLHWSKPPVFYREGGGFPFDQPPQQKPGYPPTYPPSSPARRKPPVARTKPNSIPAMRFKRGYAVVRLNSHDIYLGRWASQEAHDRYHTTLANWARNGFRWPPANPDVATVEQLGDRYVEWAKTYYTKYGRPTSGFGRVRAAFAMLFRAGLANTPATEFGPLKLQQFQRWLASHPQRRWSRVTINAYVSAIVSAFRWGTENELLPPDPYAALRVVRGLRRGRSPAQGVPAPRDTDPVQSVAAARVKAALPFMPPIVAAMVQVQSLTGMRPGEVVTMRAKDVKPSARKGVRVYMVSRAANKTDAHEIDRRVPMGPKAWAIIEPLLPESPSDYIFCRRTKGGSPYRTSPHYTVNSYTHAVRRACDAAWLKVNPPTEKPSPADVVKRERLMKAARWTPRQLRHTRATELARAEGLSVAQSQLGHARQSTTQIYVDPDDPRALAAAARSG